MTLTAGSTLGPYKILALLGAGGMGEVYRAHDTRLGRDVAIKVLSPHLAATPEVRARFEREARTVSQLNHPHICTLHDIGHQDGTDYLVLELLEGETLTHRLEKGSLPVAEVLSLGAQIADALDRAHRAGVVHRDLKPGNIMLTSSGAKLMDFGLARAAGLASAAPGAMTESPTVSRPLTKEGTIVGTFQYMAPEQLEGKETDARSDIWALGCVLYEMVTGKRAFEGQSQASLIAAIMEHEPRPIAELQPLSPPGLDHVVRRCLAKDPADRWQGARDVMHELQWIAAAGALAGVAAAAAVPMKRRAFVSAIILVIGALVVGFALGAIRGTWLGRAASRPVFQRLTFQRGAVKSARFAPDGKTVFYTATWQGQPPEILETRPGSLTSRSVGLAGKFLASISSSGTMAVITCPSAPIFWTQLGTLAEVPISGGAPRRVLDDVHEADWSPDGGTLAVVHQVGGQSRLEMPPGRVLYRTAGGIEHLRVAPSGRWLAFEDSPIPPDMRGNVIVIDRTGRVTARTEEWNQIGGLAWSADGREVWYTGSQDGATSEIRAMRPNGRQRTVESLPGFLSLYDIGRDGSVLLTSMRLPAGIRGRGPGDKEERELGWLDLSYAADISADGRTLLFDEEGLGGGPRYTVYTRGMDGSPPVRLGEGHACALSPDGRWALAIQFGPPQRLMLLPTGVGDSTSLPRGGIERYSAANWLPDGKRVIFTGNERGHAGRTYVQDIAGGLPRPATAEGLLGTMTSPDGRLAAVLSTERRIELCPIGGGTPRVIGESPPGEGILRWSADGRHLLVVSAAGDTVAIGRIDTRTGTRTPWKTVQPPAGFSAGAPAFCVTPDGRSYAYGYVGRLDDLFLVNGLR